MPQPTETKQPPPSSLTGGRDAPALRLRRRCRQQPPPPPLRPPTLAMSPSELAAPLSHLPPVEFACSYGSSLLPLNKDDKPPMVDYILGVADPLQWHSQNLEANRHHYSSWMARLGPKSITNIAEVIGVGVHFNPFVPCGDKMIKYGVVRMHDLALDMLSWNRFYLAGRLQKPVYYLIDNWDLRKINLVNLKAATSAALLLLPPEFTEEDLYAKVCDLSYKGDIRMLFAEDKNKVQKIVQGSINSFRTMYRPFLHEYMAEGFLKHSSSQGQLFKQHFDLSATNTLLSSLPSTIQNRMVRKLGGNQASFASGGIPPHIIVSSRKQAANCAANVMRRIVMVSSARQAASGVLAAGGVNAACYLAKKVSKAWKSRM